MKTIGYISTAIIVLGLSVIYSGYALTVLWEWFFVAAFGLPQIGVFNAAGIALTVGYLTQQWVSDDANKSAEEALMKVAITSFVKPSVVLIFGYVYVQFV